MHGIGGKLLLWIKAFLTDRTQRVVVNGESSELEVVKSGVPQGTVLGPLLFLIYLNDIHHVISYSTIRLFADDARLIKKINCFNDAFHLQTDLLGIMKWAEENNMVLNEDKFQYLQHKSQNSLKNALPSDLPFVFYENCYETFNEHLIYPIEKVSDLGVLISPDMSFSMHISDIVKKANSRSAWVLSVFKSRDKNALLTLFKSVVRSLVEYCCPLWSPTKQSDIQKIEGVQRNLTSKIMNCEHLHYWERLKMLNLMSLQRRRERFMIIYVWKIINNLVPNDVAITTSFSTRNGIMCDIPQLPIIRRNLNEYDRFFSVHGCRLWNMLPKNIKECDSLGNFKSSLDTYLLKFPDTPPITGQITLTSNSLLDYRHLHIR